MRLDHAAISAIDNYCRRWAEAEVRQLEHFPRELVFNHAIVIPAYREDGEFLLRLRDLARSEGGVLVIVVINQPEDDEDEGASQALHSLALDSGAERWSCGSLQVQDWPGESALLVVNRFSKSRRIPRHQGVGLARKIGCDIAAALALRDQLHSHYVYSSDADALLPADYFRKLKNQAEPERISALVFPFRHLCDDSPLGKATQLYEQSLNYYVAGLRRAGSPYAFHTIGSCLAVSLAAYCMARGFPKRAGGEDFYLLNKLAKLGRVQPTGGEAIGLHARQSSRVPFGTGPAVSRILQLADPLTYSVYHPAVFVELAHLLRHLVQLWDYRDDCQRWLDELPPLLREACEAQNLARLATHLQRQVNNKSDSRQHIHHWFDAFRTLKLIHFLQARAWPPLPIQQAMAEADRIWAEGCH